MPLEWEYGLAHHLTLRSIVWVDSTQQCVYMYFWQCIEEIVVTVLATLVTLHYMLALAEPLLRTLTKQGSRKTFFRSFNFIFNWEVVTVVIIGQM